MRHVLVIAGREIRSMFATPVAYGVLSVYAVLAGFLFFVGLGNFFRDIQRIQAMQAFQYLEVYNLNQVVIAPWLATFGIVFLLVIPLLTMRTFSEERAQGTIELLLTSPVSATELVLGKYLAVLTLLLVVLFLTCLYPALLVLYGDPELLQTLAGVLALFLYGASLAAIGCFVSATTRSQILAALLSFVIGLLLLLVSQVGVLGATGTLGEVARYLGTQAHFENGVAGRIHSEDLVYFGSLIVLFLFLARHSVEWLRWR